jgi:hypothetical protein
MPDRLSHAVFACPWCTFRALRFHPDRARLGGRLPVLRQPRRPGRLAKWAIRCRAPRARFIGIPAGRDALPAPGPPGGVDGMLYIRHVTVESAQRRVGL